MESPVLRIEVSSTSLRTELPMSETNTVSPLRQRMIEDMAARKLNPHTQRSHIYSCRRFAAWLKRSPDTATPDEVRRFQLHLIESGSSLCNRHRILRGVGCRFGVRVGRRDRGAEVWHIKEPQKLPPVLSAEEVKRVLTMATSLKAPLAEAQEQPDVAPDSPRVLPCPCPCCGGRMIVIEVFARGREPKWRPIPGRIDTS